MGWHLVPFGSTDAVEMEWQRHPQRRPYSGPPSSWQTLTCILSPPLLTFEEHLENTGKGVFLLLTCPGSVWLATSYCARGRDQCFPRYL